MDHQHQRTIARAGVGIFILLLLGLVSWGVYAGATSFQSARARLSMGNCVVRVYSGTSEIAQYESVGRPLSEQNSDGWYFEDKHTHKAVIVSGCVIIEQE